MTRKVKVTFSAKQKLEYAKLMVEGGYSNIQVEKISGAGKSAVSRWKQQYLNELNGNMPDISIVLLGFGVYHQFKFCKKTTKQH